jgi:hypothetical protein
MLVLEQAGYVPTIINPIQVMGYTNHSLFSTIFYKKKFPLFREQIFVPSATRYKGSILPYFEEKKRV